MKAVIAPRFCGPIWHPLLPRSGSRHLAVIHGSPDEASEGKGRRLGPLGVETVSMGAPDASGREPHHSMEWNEVGLGCRAAILSQRASQEGRYGQARKATAMRLDPEFYCFLLLHLAIGCSSFQQCALATPSELSFFNGWPGLRRRARLPATSPARNRLIFKTAIKGVPFGSSGRLRDRLPVVQTSAWGRSIGSHAN